MRVYLTDSPFSRHDIDDRYIGGKGRDWNETSESADATTFIIMHAKLRVGKRMNSAPHELLSPSVHSTGETINVELFWFVLFSPPFLPTQAFLLIIGSCFNADLQRGEWWPSSQ